MYIECKPEVVEGLWLTKHGHPKNMELHQRAVR